ncbi:MAG: hypothetical protein ABL958_07610 [Bdellovibrionia bacterium]
MSTGNENVSWSVTPVGRVGLRPDGIVCCEITPEVEQTPDSARKNLLAAFRVAGDRRRPIIVDLRGALPLGTSTRRVYTNKDIGQSFSAIALVIHMDIVSRSMANVYLHIAKLPVPAKIFSEFSEAVAWVSKRKS